MSLWSLFLRHRGRIVDKWAHYFPIYERHFGRYVNTPFLFIEIGCGKGGSLQLWKEYFGPMVTIVGIDIEQRCRRFEGDQVHVRIGDQSDPGFLASVIAEFGTPAIVLDDGSHVMSDIRASFDHLYPVVSPDGVYMVEDLHTAYWDEYGGGAKRDGSFIELCKDLIDQVNATHSRGAVPETAFSRSTLSMHFYDSVVVFEKGAYGPRRSLQMGKRKRPRASTVDNPASSTLGD